MTYKHLSQAETYQIYALMKAGHNQSQIARLLDRNKSTISRELSRNTGARGYRPMQACEISTQRDLNSRNGLLLSLGRGIRLAICCARNGEPAPV